MIVPRSVPGDWFAVVTDGVVVLLPPTTPGVLLDSVWTAVRGGADVDGVHALVDGEVAACAAVTIVGGTLRAVLLGDVDLAVQVGTEPQVVHGVAGRWSVHEAADACGFAVSAPDAVTYAATALPVLAAVVPSASVELDVTAPAIPAGSVDGAAAAEETDEDEEFGDTYVGVSPALRAQVDALAAVAAASAPEDHLDAETVLSVGSGLRARVEALAAEDASSVPAAPAEDVSPGEVDHLDAETVLAIDPATRARAHALAEVDDAPPPADEAPAPGTDGYATEPASGFGAEALAGLGPVGADQHAYESGVPTPRSPETVPDVPVRPVRPAPLAASAVVPAEADHDGLTVMSSDLVEIRKNLPTWEGDRVPGPFAVPVDRGHARLRMSSGLVVALDRVVLIGRAPVVSRVPNRSLPRLVTVPSPHHDISRTHAQVQDDGDRVFVTDLHSTNGIVVHAGGTSTRLAPGVPTLLPVGATVDIGDGVTFSVVRDR